MDKTDGTSMRGSSPIASLGRLKVTAVMQEQFIALQRLTRMRYHLVIS
nr:hypothetical protein [Anoxybacillus flavithermus]